MYMYGRSDTCCLSTAVGNAFAKVAAMAAGGPSACLSAVAWWTHTILVASASHPHLDLVTSLCNLWLVKQTLQGNKVPATYIRG